MPKRKIMRIRIWDNCTINKVVDGDTVYVQRKKDRVKVRLYGIDTPEIEQNGGEEAFKFLYQWHNKKVRVRIITFYTDYGRIIAILYDQDGKCLNEELVKNGHAWVYITYCRTSICEQWKILQKKAKAQKLGLWSKQYPLPPWEYRKDYLFRATQQTRIFHNNSCPKYRKEGIGFNDKDNAIKNGYRPCLQCVRK